MYKMSQSKLLFDEDVEEEEEEDEEEEVGGSVLSDLSQGDL